MLLHSFIIFNINDDVILSCAFLIFCVLYRIPWYFLLFLYERKNFCHNSFKFKWYVSIRAQSKQEIMEFYLKFLMICFLLILWFLHFTVVYHPDAVYCYVAHKFACVGWWCWFVSEHISARIKNMVAAVDCLLYSMKPHQDGWKYLHTVHPFEYSSPCSQKIFHFMLSKGTKENNGTNSNTIQPQVTHNNVSNVISNIQEHKFLLNDLNKLYNTNYRWRNINRYTNLICITK